MIQNHPPTPVRNSKYLATPPTPLLLRNIKMVPYENQGRHQLAESPIDYI